MYQEIQATIVLTYSADATLSRLELLDHVLADACRLLDGDGDNGLELVHVKLEGLREEAQIYDADDAPRSPELARLLSRLAGFAAHHASDSAMAAGGRDLVADARALLARIEGAP